MPRGKGSFDDDLARATMDGGNRVLNKPFNSTVTGGEGTKPSNNRQVGNFAASGKVDNIFEKELFNIINALTTRMN